ncbi:MAG: efflux RND transporter periplasmic adaptor subunit [Wenzhouxiangellaceae bacterium]|nr:efflux RND transporter periplasmic adaptor subunit [Wenzhouxiangellaceae bacterium]
MNRLPNPLPQLFAAAAAIAMLAGCNAGANSTPDASKEPDPALPVEAATVAAGDVSATWDGSTTLEPERTAQVVAKLDGVVLEILVEEGDRVEKGQLLARLEDDRYRLQLEQAAVSMRQLEGELARARELHERKLISADEFERIRAAAEAQQAAHALARLELDHTGIRAPISGVVSQRLVKAGNLVGRHEPLFVVDDFDPLWAVLHVPERQLGLIRAGLQARLVTDAFPERVFRGEVLRARPVVDPETGTFEVTVSFSDDEGLLRPGLFSRVSVVHDRRSHVAMVPGEALLSEDGARSVFVLVPDESGPPGTAWRVEKRSVVTGYENEDAVEIVDGLEIGEAVVTAGKIGLRDGVRVKVVES